MCIIDVILNNPPYNPIPFSKYVRYKLLKADIKLYVNIIIPILPYKIETSDLIVSPFEKSKMERNTNNTLKKKR